jgi:hypothetical protein
MARPQVADGGDGLQAVMDSQERVVLQAVEWAETNNSLREQNSKPWSVYTGPRTFMITVMNFQVP